MKKIENAELLYKAVLALETKKECEKFFDNQELIAWLQANFNKFDIRK